MTRRYDVLIVGAGQAGAQVALSLRQHGYAGSIGIVGAENEPPYERPPLSKEYLMGELGAEALQLRPQEFWPGRSIDLCLGVRIVSVLPEAHQAMTDAGETIDYGVMVWATGGEPRRLPCHRSELGGVHLLRTRVDADRLRSELCRANRAVVVGAGYVGLETAAALNSLGFRVTVVEAVDRVLARVAGPEISEFYAREHSARGVEFVFGGLVDALLGEGQVSGVRLSDGRTLPANLVVVGIGLIPSVEVLAEAGATVADGVVVDALCQTSLPDIYAVGDCARHPNAYAATPSVRLESVQNAIDQAKTVAGAIAGRPVPYSALPWFWSNQYDLALQTAGLSAGYDATIVRGDPASRAFSVLYLREGAVIAIDSVNSPADFTQGKRLVTRRAQADVERLADPATPLKDLAA